MGFTPGDNGLLDLDVGVLGLKGCNGLIENLLASLEPSHVEEVERNGLLSNRLRCGGDDNRLGLFFDDHSLHHFLLDDHGLHHLFRLASCHNHRK